MKTNQNWFSRLSVKTGRRSYFHKVLRHQQIQIYRPIRFWRVAMANNQLAYLDSTMKVPVAYFPSYLFFPFPPIPFVHPVSRFSSYVTLVRSFLSSVCGSTLLVLPTSINNGHHSLSGDLPACLLYFNHKN